MGMHLEPQKYVNPMFRDPASWARSCLLCAQSCRPSARGSHGPCPYMHSRARPSTQHFQKLCFCAREFVFKPVFDPNCTKHVPNTYTIYTHSKT